MLRLHEPKLNYFKEQFQPEYRGFFSIYVKPLFENIFRHFWPRQFKAQIPTGLDHNK